MADGVQLPIFTGTPVQKARKCISWTWKTLKKLDYSADDVRARVFRETPAQLIAQRGVFYMNPCAPQTVTCLEVLKANGFHPDIVIDLTQIKGNLAPHFAIELKIGAKMHAIEFKTTGVNFGPGKYDHAWYPHDSSIRKFRVSGNRFGLHKTLLDATPRRIRVLAFGKGYNIQHHADRLAQEVAPEKYARFKKVILSRVKPKTVIHRQTR